MTSETSSKKILSSRSCRSLSDGVNFKFKLKCKIKLICCHSRFYFIVVNNNTEINEIRDIKLLSRVCYGFDSDVFVISVKLSNHCVGSSIVDRIHARYGRTLVNVSGVPTLHVCLLAIATTLSSTTSGPPLS